MRNKGEALKAIYRFYRNDNKKLMKAIKSKTIPVNRIAENIFNLKLVNEVIKDLELNL